MSSGPARPYLQSIVLMHTPLMPPYLGTAEMQQRSWTNPPFWVSPFASCCQMTGAMRVSAGLLVAELGVVCCQAW